MKLIIITPCIEKHKIFLSELSDRIKKSCEKANIKYIHLIDDKKGFPSVIRNRLLEFVNDDDYVAFMDADDFPLEDWAKSINIYLNIYNVVYSDYIFFESNKVYHSQKFNYKIFRKENFIPFSTVAMRGNIAKQVRFRSIYYAEDWVFLHETYKITQSFGYIPKSLVVRRIETSINKSNIPVYRKLLRLYRIYKVKQIIKSL